MDITVTHEPDRHRHVAVVEDGRAVGFVVDHVDDDRHMLVHTEVEDVPSGSGVGTAMVRQVLDAIRDEGGTVVPRCPFVRSVIERNPEYTDLVVEEHGVAFDGEGATG